jgi:aminoglycoside 3-N-acetyltransferase
VGIITSLRQIRQEVREAFAGIDSDAVVLHTNIMRVGFLQPDVPRERNLADLFEAIKDGASGRTLLFPTYNYDFCRTRIYDPLADPCQVGVLNEYVRRLNPGQRTLTPIFNFCIHDNHAFSLEPVDNVFSKASTFGELVTQGATVAFFGALFEEANTFLYHAEEIMNVGYRYVKPFPGVIRRSHADTPIELRYRVRPLIEGAVVYDGSRQTRGLADNGLLHRRPLGNAEFLWYRADRVLDYWRTRLEEDELDFLTADSQKRVQELYAHYGRPLRYEAVEPQSPRPATSP